MKKLDFGQMENIQGGEIRWCVVGKWVSGLGVVALALGATFTCGAAAVAYAAIVGATVIAC
jgi:hypothetical protein